MKSNLIKIACLLMIVSFAFSCGDAGNALSGSVSDFDWWYLSFDRIDVKLRNEGIQVRYLRDVEGAVEPDIVVSVIVLRDGLQIDPGVEIDLANFGAVDRFVRERDDSGALVEDSHRFPPIENGTIIFNKLSRTHGRPVAGKFFITFTTGYTLNGSFSADLIVQE